jgi:hypothetical protein
VAGGLVGAFIANQPRTWQFEAAPTAALSQVEGTLAPKDKERLIEEARRCREPLGRVAIWHSASTDGGTVSIISGSYRSPSFPLTATPSLVALPFPAPYASGRGVLTVVGEATDFGIALSPQLIMTRINGPMPVNVWWTSVGGCP